MPNEIYNFLKENELTTKDEASFLQEYSDTNKAKELHGFFVDNQLTKKGFDDFYSAYFSGLGKPAPEQLGAGGSGMSSPSPSGELGAIDAVTQKEDEARQKLEARQRVALDIEKQLRTIPERVTTKRLSELNFTPQDIEFAKGITQGKVDAKYYDGNWKRMFGEMYGVNPLALGVNKEQAKPILMSGATLSAASEKLMSVTESHMKEAEKIYPLDTFPDRDDLRMRGLTQKPEYVAAKKQYDRALKEFKEQIEPVNKRFETTKTFVNLQKDINAGGGVRMKAADVQKALDEKINVTIGGQGANELYQAKQSGDEKRIKEAESVYFSDVNRKIDETRQIIESLRAEGSLNPQIEKALNGSIQSFESEKTNFYKSPEEVEAQFTLVKPEYSTFQKAMNALTPQERLKMYMISRIDRLNNIAMQNGMDAADVEEILSTGSGNFATWLGRATTRINSDDYKEILGIAKEVRSIYPAAMLNVQPVSKNRTSLIDRAKNSFLSTFGAEGLNDDEKAANVLGALGLTETQQEITPESERFLETQTKPISGTERAADLVGMTAAIVPEFMVGSGVVNVLLRGGQAMTKVPAISQTAKWIRGTSLPQKMVNRGLSFEATAKIFPEQEDEGTFAVGAAGAVGEALVGGIGKYSGRLIRATFGNKSNQALEALSKFGGTKVVGQGLTELGEETAENLVSIYQQSDTWEDALATLKATYGNQEEALWNAMSPIVLGTSMGVGTKIGKQLADSYRTEKSTLSPEQQAVADQISADLIRQQNQAAQQMLLETISDVPTSELQESVSAASNVVDKLQEFYDAYVSTGATGEINMNIEGNEITIDSIEEFNAVMDAHKDMLAAIEVELANRAEQTATEVQEGVEAGIAPEQDSNRQEIIQQQREKRDAEVEETAKVLEESPNISNEDYYEALDMFEAALGNIRSETVAEAYHAAKAKPESEQTAQEQQLVKAVEELLTPKTESDAVQEQTAGKVSAQPKAEDSGEVAKGTPEAKPKETAKESPKKELTAKEKANKSIDDFAEKLKKKLAPKGTEGLQKMGIGQNELIDMVADLVKQLTSLGIDAKKAITQAIAKTRDVLSSAGINMNSIISEAQLTGEIITRRKQDAKERAKQTRKENKEKIEKLAQDIVSAVKKITPKREFYANYQTLADFKAEYLKNNPNESEARAESEYKKQRHSDYMNSVQKATEQITKQLRDKVESAKGKTQLEAAKDSMIELLAGITDALQELGIKKIKVNDVNKLIDAIALANTSKSFNTQVAKTFEIIDKVIASAEEGARKNAINEIRKLLDASNALYKKQQGQKIAKAKYDRQAKSEIEEILSGITDEMLETMPLQDLNTLFNAIYDSIAGGKERIKAVVDAIKAINVASHRRLMEQVADKNNLTKEVVGGNNIIAEVKKGNIVKIGNTFFKGNEALQVLNDMIVRGELTTLTEAKVIPILPTAPRKRQGILQGIRAGANAYLGFLYDFMTDEASLRWIEESLYEPVVKAEMNKDNQTFAAKKRKNNARVKIFGSNRAARRAINKNLPFKLEDVNGNEFTMTVDEAIYVFNVTQRAAMNLKAVGKDSIGKTLTEDSLDKIYDYILSNGKLNEYAKWQISEYESHLEGTNDVLERNGYATIDRERMVTPEKYAEKIGKEGAERYFERMKKVFGDALPEFEPYSPAQIEGAEIGQLQERSVLGAGGEQALSVMSNNVRAIKEGGALKIASSELMMSDWQRGIINMNTKMDLLKMFNTVFNKDFRNMLADIYGTRYAKEFEKTIEDIIIGNTGEKGGLVSGWLNGATQTVMTLNLRSAIFQYMSMPNYALADGVFSEYVQMLGNVKSYNKYTAEVSELEWVRERVEGDLSSIELKQLREGKTKYEKFVSSILSAGYVLTRFSDTSAIINGGAPYYAVMKEKRMKELIDSGMKSAEAESKAKEYASEKLYRRTQETQQSSKPYEMSGEQKNPLIRFALSFGTVGLQYTRKTARAIRDIRNGRGNTKENVAIIAYFGVLNSVLFTALSRFAGKTMEKIMDDDDDEDDLRKNKEFAQYLNQTVDSGLRGLGAMGVVASSLKNSIYDISLQVAKRKLSKEETEFYRELFDILTLEGETPESIQNKDKSELMLEFAGSFSIPLSIKARQFDRMFKGMADINEAGGFETTAATLEFLANIPAHRMYSLFDQFADAYASDIYSPAQRIIRALNLVSKYELQLNEERKELSEITKKLNEIEEGGTKATKQMALGWIRELNTKTTPQVDSYVQKLSESIADDESGNTSKAIKILQKYYNGQIESVFGKNLREGNYDKSVVSSTEKAIKAHKNLKSGYDDIESYYQSPSFNKIGERLTKYSTSDKKDAMTLAIQLHNNGFNTTDIDYILLNHNIKNLESAYSDYINLDNYDKLKLKISLYNESKNKHQPLGFLSAWRKMLMRF